MSRKGENIFKRKDGRWEARYVKGHEPSGKIKYGFCYGKSYQEAKEKVIQARLLLEKGIPPALDTSHHRFAFFCAQWIKQQQPKVKESTFVKYHAILEHHINPKLGGCHPLALSTEIIESFKDELLYEQELSPKTTKDILIVLQSILKYTEKQFHGKFPNIEIVYPRERPREMRVLSPEEQHQFTAYLLKDLDYCKFGILLAMSTGIRIGELCALRWENISVKNKLLRINATMQRLNNFDVNFPNKTKIFIGPPKSSTSFRFIPLPENINQLCRKMKPKQADAFVLTGSQFYMEPRTLQYRLKKYTLDCGLDGVHFHTLRHTFATRCVEVGFEIKSLSEILGHSSTSITLNRYIHSSLHLKRDNMNKLASLDT